MNQEKKSVLPRRKVLGVGLSLLLVGGYESSVFYADLSDMREENIDNEKILRSAVSPKITVTNSFLHGDSFATVTIGDSLSLQYCGTNQDKTFPRLRDIVSQNTGGLVGLEGKNGYLLGLSQLGAESGQIARLVQANLPKAFDANELENDLIYLTFLGSNDILSLFMGENNQPYALPYYVSGMKERIDRKVDQFRVNAKQIYDELLLHTKGTYARFPSQALAFFTPDITQLPIVQNASVRGFVLDQMKYAVLKTNIATLQLSEYYKQKNRTLAFVNLYDQRINHDEICSRDGLHPNARGYEAIEALGAQLFTYKGDM